MHEGDVKSKSTQHDMQTNHRETIIPFLTESAANIQQGLMQFVLQSFLAINSMAFIGK